MPKGLQRRLSVSHRSRHLPIELVDEIISLLHSEKYSLKACSLVCRSWVPCSRFHLFEHLSISTRVGEFFDCLRSPLSTLSPAIRSLKVDLPLGEELTGSQLKVIIKMTALLSFKLACHDIRASVFAEIGAVVVPNVKELALDMTRSDRPDNILRILCLFPCLLSLTLEAGHSGDIEIPPPARLPSTLRNLTVNDTDFLPAIINWISQHDPIPSISTLSIKYAWDVHPLLDVLGKTLEHLTVNMESRGFLAEDASSQDTLLSSVNPAHIVNLRSIRIRIQDLDLITSICMFISQLQCPQLESVAFYFDTYSRFWDISIVNDPFVQLAKTATSHIMSLTECVLILSTYESLYPQEEADQCVRTIQAQLGPNADIVKVLFEEEDEP